MLIGKDQTGGLTIDHRRHYLLDATRTRLYVGKPPYTCLKLFRVIVYRRNWQFSGLPGAKPSR